MGPIVLLRRSFLVGAGLSALGLALGVTRSARARARVRSSRSTRRCSSKSRLTAA